MTEPNFRKLIIDRLKELYAIAPNERQLMGDTIALLKALGKETKTTAQKAIDDGSVLEGDVSVVFSAETGALTMLLQYAALGMLEFKTARILG